MTRTRSLNSPEPYAGARWHLGSLTHVPCYVQQCSAKLQSGLVWRYVSVDGRDRGLFWSPDVFRFLKTADFSRHSFIALDRLFKLAEKQLRFWIWKVCSREAVSRCVSDSLLNVASWADLSLRWMQESQGFTEFSGRGFGPDEQPGLGGGNLSMAFSNFSTWLHWLPLLIFGSAQEFLKALA